MTDTVRNDIIVVSVFLTMALCFIAPFLFDWGYNKWKAWRNRASEDRVNEDQRDYLRHFPAPMPPRMRYEGFWNSEDLNIPTRSQVTHDEMITFCQLVSDLDADMMQISLAESIISGYVQKCRQERRLLDRGWLTVLGRAVAEAQGRRRLNFADGFPNQRRTSTAYELLSGTLLGYQIIEHNDLFRLGIRGMRGESGSDLVTLITAENQEILARPIYIKDIPKPPEIESPAKPMRQRTLIMGD